MGKGALSTVAGLVLLVIGVMISVTIITTQTGVIEDLLRGICATTFAPYIPFCNSELESLDDRIAMDSMSALSCAVNSASAERMDPETCPGARNVGEDTRCYGKTCVMCDRFGGVEEVRLPADPQRALDTVGNIIIDCYRFAESGQNVYCAKLDTSQMGRAEVSKQMIIEWLMEDGGDAGKKLLGLKGLTARLSFYDMDAIKKDFSGSNKVAIYSDNAGVNEVWIADAQPARPENVPEDIWEMRIMARQVRIAFKDRAEAIENIGFELLECFEAHVKSALEDYYCAQIDTSVWDESVVVTESEIREWLRLHGGKSGKDLIGEGVFNLDNLGWKAGTVRRNSPAIISIFTYDGLTKTWVYVYNPFSHEIPASEEPQTFCNLTDFELPQGDGGTTDWIPYWGDPKYLAYWQAFPVEEDTWTYKPDWATYAAIGVISVIPPLKAGRILLVTPAKTLLSKLIPRLGAYWARNAVKSAVTKAALEKAITATLAKQTKTDVALLGRRRLASQINEQLPDAIKEIDKEMADRFAKATAGEAPALAEEYAGKVVDRAFDKAAASSPDFTLEFSKVEAKDALAPVISKRAGLIAARQMGISGMKEQFKNLLIDRWKEKGITTFEALAMKSKDIAGVAARAGIYTTEAWALSIADSMAQARFEPANDKLALKPAARKIVTYDLSKHWPVLVLMPNVEDYWVLPQVFDGYKSFHIASPCHLSTLDVKRVIVQCGEYTYNMSGKTSSCTGKISVKEDFGAYSCSDYLNPETESPYMGPQGPIAAMTKHVKYILALRDIPDIFRYIYDGRDAVFPLYYDASGADANITFYFNPDDSLANSDRIRLDIKGGKPIEIPLSRLSKREMKDSSSRIAYTWLDRNQEYGIDATVMPEFDSTRTPGSPTPTTALGAFEYGGKAFVRYSITFRYTEATCRAGEACSKLSAIDGLNARFGAETDEAQIGKQGGEWGGVVAAAEATSLKLTTSSASAAGGIDYIDDDLDGDLDSIIIRSVDKKVTLSDNYDEGTIDSFQLKGCSTYAASVEGMVKAKDGEKNYCTRGKGTGTAWAEWGNHVAAIGMTITAGFFTGGTAWAIAAVAAATELSTGLTEEYMGKWPSSW